MSVLDHEIPTNTHDVVFEDFEAPHTFWDTCSYCDGLHLESACWLRPGAVRPLEARLRQHRVNKLSDFLGRHFTAEQVSNFDEQRWELAGEACELPTPIMSVRRQVVAELRTRALQPF